MSTGSIVIRNVHLPFEDRPLAQKLYDVHCVDGRVAAVGESNNLDAPRPAGGGGGGVDDHQLELEGDICVEGSISSTGEETEINAEGQGILLPSFVLCIASDVAFNSRIFL